MRIRSNSEVRRSAWAFAGAIPFFGALLATLAYVVGRFVLGVPGRQLGSTCTAFGIVGAAAMVGFAIPALRLSGSRRTVAMLAVSAVFCLMLIALAAHFALQLQIAPAQEIEAVAWITAVVWSSGFLWAVLRFKTRKPATNRSADPQIGPVP